MAGKKRPLRLCRDGAAHETESGANKARNRGYSKHEGAGETLWRWLLNEFERIQNEAGGRT